MNTEQYRSFKSAVNELIALRRGEAANGHSYMLAVRSVQRAFGLTFPDSDGRTKEQHFETWRRLHSAIFRRAAVVAPEHAA